MKNTFTQSMAWLHTWAGLIFGWLLFAIFATGTLAVFDSEIDNWMRPEVRSHDLTQLQAAQRGLAYLTQHAPGASNWNISLPDARSPGLQVASGERRRGGGTPLDPHTGEPIEVRETAGGSFFFRFHFTLNLPRNCATRTAPPGSSAAWPCPTRPPTRTGSRHPPGLRGRAARHVSARPAGSRPDPSCDGPRPPSADRSRWPSARPRR